MSYDHTQAPRDYGGWRRRRGIGLFGLGATGTLAVLGALLVLIIVAAASPAALLYAGPPILAAGGLGLARAGGEPLALAALRRMRWRYAGTRGYTRYRAGVVAQHSPAYQMPGVLAPLELLDCEDGYGGRYGIVLDKRSGLMTPTLRVVPASTWLADREDADGWVANWGGWLASLGYLPMCRWVTVTVDTAPEPGTSLANLVAAALDPAAPLAARQIMAQLVQAAPAAAADVDTRVSITFDPKLSPAAPADVTAAAAEVGRTLHGLESALSTCGASVLGRATATEIAGVVRTAADPASRGEVNRILARVSRRRARRRDELGRGRAGRRAGDPGLLPARQRHLRDLGVEGGAAADRDRRRARPPGRSRPPSQAGVAPVPAVPGRRGDPRPGQRGQRRPVPGDVQAPHRPGRDSPGHL